jgi:peptidoglycan hydrolase-like protein with peptidoglycan-binding domain
VIGGPPVVVTRDYYGPAYYPYGPAYYPSSVAIDVQVALGRRGYYHGPADGVIGRGSRAAIRAYQADHHLGVTGRINRPLLHSLGR